MTLSFISFLLSTAACACWAYVIYIKNDSLRIQEETIQAQQIYIDALKRQLEAAERIIQRGLYDEETLRRK